MPKFRIEQIALYPADPAKAIAFLSKIGMGEWARDHVHARGEVFGEPAENQADLAFNYESIAETGKLELEVLRYTRGENWVEHGARIDKVCVSHLGMHVTEAELVEWREFMAAEGIAVAQEVETLSHTNPVIVGKRRYNYVIFDTYWLLGTDLKFIVRHMIEPAAA